MINPLVMIPGMMCDKRLFRHQIIEFSSELPIKIADIAECNSVEEQAKHILQQAPDKFSLLGLSMGGIIAMEILRQDKARVERVALFDTNPLAENDAVKARRIPQIEAVKRGELSRVMREEMKPNYLANGPRQQDILDLCMAMAEKLGPDVFIAQSYALMNRKDQQETLRSLDIPAMILCGRDDVLCPVARHELMYELISNASLEIIEEAGHMPVLEQVERTNKKIRKWLEL